MLTKKRIVCYILLGLIFCLELLIFLFPSSFRHPIFIAHRGHGNYENTVSNFYNSGKYTAIECDVRITKDKQFVICHDATQNFVDGSFLVIKDYTLEELRAKKIDNKQYICTFEEYLNICEETNKLPIIEIKDELSKVELQNLVDLTSFFSFKDSCIFISFKHNNLLELKKLVNNELYLVFKNNRISNLKFCIKNNINASMQYRLLTPLSVNRLHKKGLKVDSWTCNSPYSILYSKFCNVDYITSDKYYK